jgi:tetratricopeptide (TPR) repeat protein
LQQETNQNISAADSLYSENGMPDALDRAAADHEAYAASRRTLYFGREEYAHHLAAHVNGDGPPLVVTGDPGAGKSALLANWTHFWIQRNPETPLLIHFIGAAPDTTGWILMLRRFLGEFHRLFATPVDIPDDPSALRVAFANALHMVAARSPIVLVIDGLDQLEDQHAALDLDWLPPVIPSNIRLIVSAHSGRPWADLQKRTWPVLTVRPLVRDEREALIVAYLARYEKTVGAPVVQQIAAARPSGNALYLTTLLNELRSLDPGDKLDQHDGFEERLAWYLEANDPLELFTKALERWEHDAAARGPLCEDLAGESLTRIWAARRGLSEAELLASLGTLDVPFPLDMWRSLSAAMGDALVNRNGLLTLAHPLLRQAVHDAYLPNVEDQQSVHLTLATSFYGQPKGPRQLEELPWQWQHAAEWKSLSFLLAQPQFFAALWNKEPLDVKNFWTAIEANSPLRMETVYAPAIRKLADPHHVGRVGQMLAAMGRTHAALRIFSSLAKHFRIEPDRAALQFVLGGQAAILQSRGDLDGALKLYQEQEQICRSLQASLSNHPASQINSLAISTLAIKKSLQSAIAGQAAILYAHSDLERALELYQQQETLSRELGNSHGVAAAVSGQAAILHSRGNMKGALALLDQHESMCRARGDKINQATSLGTQAMILQDHENSDGALELLSTQERIFRELGDQEGIASSLGNQATILSSRGDLNGAMARYKEQERICREVDHPEGLAISLVNQAVVLIGANRVGEARTLADLALGTATHHNLQQLIPGIQRIRDSITPANQD